jgi:hypothetical protein
MLTCDVRQHITAPRAVVYQTPGSSAELVQLVFRFASDQYQISSRNFGLEVSNDRPSGLLQRKHPGADGRSNFQNVPDPAEKRVIMTLSHKSRYQGCDHFPRFDLPHCYGINRTP